MIFDPCHTDHCRLFDTNLNSIIPISGHLSIIILQSNFVSWYSYIAKSTLNTWSRATFKRLKPLISPNKLIGCPSIGWAISRVYYQAVNLIGMATWLNEFGNLIMTSLPVLAITHLHDLSFWSVSSYIVYRQL